MTNMTWADNVSDPFQPIEAVNTQLGGALGVGIIISSALIMWISLRYYQKDADEILIYVGAFEFIITSLLIAIEWIAFYWVMIPISLLFAGILLKIFTRG